MTRSWYSLVAVPRSTSSLMTVFFATPVMRTVLRIELPSTNAATTWARRCAFSLFIRTIILDRSRLCKQFSAPCLQVSARLATIASITCIHACK